MTAGNLIGFLGALVLMAGRWNFARISDDADSESFLAQPRVWLIAAMAVVVLLQLSRPLAAIRLRLEWSDGWLLALFGYLIVSVTWAPESELTSLKTIEITLEASAILLLAASRSLFDWGRVESGFWGTLLVVGLGLALLAISATVTGRVVAPGGGPITFGRNMGLMGMAAWRLAERRTMFYQLIASFVMVLAILMVVMCGSRGALLAYAGAGSVLVVLARLSWLHKALVISLIACLAAGAMTFTDAGRNASEVFQNRIVETTFERHHLAGRESLWEQAGDMAREKPVFGWGINGFRANSWIYPHNLFLEVLVEGGGVGIFMLLLALACWARRWRKLRRHVYAGSVAAFALAMISAQTSGDLYDSRCAFLLLIMATPSAAMTARGALFVRRNPVATGATLRRGAVGA